VVKVIWHKNASPRQMDDSIVFTRWRQCAFPCRHIGATWRIRLNLCFLQPTWVHNPNGKFISLAVFAQLTAESPYTYNGLFFPPKLPSRWGYLDSHLIHDSLGPPQSSTQTVSQSIQPFLQGWLVWQTDRPTDRLTDHAIWSVTIYHIYVCSTGDAV